MPGRDTTIGSSKAYRFGFNGKEMDNDTYGGHGNEYDYGFRIYNPRIGRFLSVDPLIGKFPWYTPYEYAGNKPIKYPDLEGLQTPEDDGAEEDKEENSERLARGAKIVEALDDAKEEEVEKKRFEELLKKPPLQRFREFALRGIRGYGDDVFSSMREVFGGNEPLMPYPRTPLNEQLIKANKANGALWEDEVTQYLKSNPNYKTVVNQVTLVVSGTVNGKLVSARIRIDNVAINRNDGSVELFDAKYSVEQITVNNVTQTLTGKQSDAFDILINGENINVVFRGGLAKSKGTGFYSGQDITGKIKSVSIISPALSTSKNPTSNTTSNDDKNQNNTQTNSKKIN